MAKFTLYWNKVLIFGIFYLYLHKYPQSDEKTTA